MVKEWQAVLCITHPCSEICRRMTENSRTCSVFCMASRNGPPEPTRIWQKNSGKILLFSVIRRQRCQCFGTKTVQISPHGCRDMQKAKKKKKLLQGGFEPLQRDPIGFRVHHPNHLATNIHVIMSALSLQFKTFPLVTFFKTFALSNVCWFTWILTANFD